MIPNSIAMVQPNLEDIDFFTAPENRLAMLSRESNRCFYCLRSLDRFNYVIEHVASRPDGDNGYRNVVAACRGCNNRKGSTAAEGFLRSLYRDGILSAEDLQARIEALGRLGRGELKPLVRGSELAL